ncbi:HD domain-containing protein [uncultured Roseibium sp.]|uniref:HD domain-containing protein n=1 Tax=uncultured Roseibium sp. TaxID=1936171 RepID=UPI00260C7683|nr:HD domain-containing protein [uncultured Roseibium sp.]
MNINCEPAISNDHMGTVSWGKRLGDFSHGRLTRLEKIQVLGNLGRMALLETVDALKERAGLLSAFGTDLDGLQPPDTALTRDAFDFADDVQGMELMRHSWRTYYWAVLFGKRAGLDTDLELLFSAAILHDVGLARDRASEPGDCCFVVYGADRCKEHLVGKGHDRAKIRKIAEAIGLHLNGYVSKRLHGVEAHLLSRGAMCDVFGLGRRRLSSLTQKQIFAEQPKGNLIDDLEIWPGHHLAGTRADFLIRLNHKDKSTSQHRRKIQPKEV